MRRCVLRSFLALLAAGGATATEAGLDLLTVVRWTLERDPNVALEEARLEAARGGLLVARGEFDPVVTASTTASESRIPDSTDSSTDTRSLESTLGLTHKLRSGLSFEPELSLTRREGLDASAPAVNEGTVTFRIRQPLLRGRGRAVTTAREAAAERELEAAALDLEQRISDRLRTVVSQYWTWVAAEVDLTVLRASEASSRELLEKTRLLIEADQVPAAEVVQLEANLASKESATIGGEQALFRARQDLGREIGLEAGEIAALPRPADGFPALDASAVPGLGEASLWVDEARRRRADHRAAEARREGAEILRRAAASDLQPLLDLIFAPTWSGFDTGDGAGRYFAPLGRNVPGAGAALGFSLLWPTGNREAEGVLIQSEAALRQRALEVERVAKALGADVPAALDGLRRSAQRLEKARQAVRLFERAVVNEEKKLRAGTSTLLDLISQQDRLTAARQGEVAAELAVAQALVRLRFETGTLFADRGEAAEIQASRLITVPTVGRDEP